MSPSKTGHNHPDPSQAIPQTSAGPRPDHQATQIQSPRIPPPPPRKGLHPEARAERAEGRTASTQSSIVAPARVRRGRLLHVRRKPAGFARESSVIVPRPIAGPNRELELRPA